jgi:hypothetical protein
LKISGGKREGKMRAAIVIGILFMMMASLGAATVDSAELGWGGPAHNYYNLKGMYGNVSEWCNDFVGPYEWGTFVNPIGPAWTSDTAKQHVFARRQPVFLRAGRRGQGRFHRIQDRSRLRRRTVNMSAQDVWTPGSGWRFTIPRRKNDAIPRGNPQDRAIVNWVVSSFPYFVSSPDIG